MSNDVFVEMECSQLFHDGEEVCGDDFLFERLEAENVQVSLLVASAKLSYALAMAAKRGAPNGEVEDGVEQYREAMRAFKRLERKLVARNNSEGA